MKTTNETERAARDEQTYYGHAEAKTSLEGWLGQFYAPGRMLPMRLKAIADEFLSGAPKDVLEIGAASGDMSAYLSTLYPKNRYTVSDLSQKGLERFFPKVAAHFGAEAEGFRMAAFSAEKMPFADGSFDVVLIKAAVHHFEDPRRAFMEIARVLRPKGRVIFINDPVCVDIPIMGFLQRRFHGKEEKKDGFNEHMYALRGYLSFGEHFRKASWRYDPFYMKEIEASSARWSGLKGLAWKLIVRSSFLYRQFFAYEFSSAFIFVFEK